MSHPRILVVPAAGLGSRLGGTLPKALVPVNGRPILDHLWDLYAPWVDGIVVVVSPQAHDAVAQHVAARRRPAHLVVQPAPSGMLDAILLPAGTVRAEGASEVWVTWCDQVAVHPDTVARLAALADAERPPLIVPTCPGPLPYIHFGKALLATLSFSCSVGMAAPWPTCSPATYLIQSTIGTATPATMVASAPFTVAH